MCFVLINSVQAFLILTKQTNFYHVPTPHQQQEFLLQFMFVARHHPNPTQEVSHLLQKNKLINTYNEIITMPHTDTYAYVPCNNEQMHI